MSTGDKGDIQVGKPAIPPGAGKQHVPTELALFVIRGTFTDPRTGTVTPLPPHSWALPSEPEQGNFTILGHGSDFQGISKVPRPTRKVTISPSRPLILVPLPHAAVDAKILTSEEQAAEGRLARSFYDAYASEGEAWIDLDQMIWVVNVPRFQLEKRRLLRIPYWNSADKAQTGGFLSAPPQSDFAKDGKIDLTTILPHGRPSAPWEIRIDHNWFGAHLQLRYYDARAMQERVVPPGLVIDAQDEPTGKRLGAGVHISDDVAYILHARTRKQVQERVLYNYQLNQAPVIDLTVAASLEPAETASLPMDFDSVRSRYLLPNEWNTLGMEVIQGQRKDWRDFRKIGWTATRDTPLVFHLDDAILVDSEKVAPVVWQDEDNLTSHPFSLLDHELAVREPRKNAPQLWDKQIERNYLRAEDTYFVAGKGFDQTTLLIYHGGTFYQLGEERATASLFVCVGLRAAVQLDLVQSTDDGDCSLFYHHVLVDCTARPSDSAEGGRQLVSHLLIHVPYFGMEGSNIDRLMAEAARRWNQKHPSDPGGPGVKDYIIAPAAETSSAPGIAKLFHYFAPGRAGITSLQLFSREPGFRSMAARDAKGATVLHYSRGDEGFDTAAVAPDLFNGDVNKAKKFEALNTEDAKADDDASFLAKFVLAHELGHVLGLPDEYFDHISHAGTKPGGNDAFDVAKDLVPSFSAEQDGQPRPYSSDKTGMMVYSHNPRLRYLWNRVGILNAIEGQSATTPWVAAYLSNGSGAFRYSLPDLSTMSTPSSLPISPWTPVQAGNVPATDKNPVRPSRWSLFALGDDDWRARAGFARFDGLVTIETHFWFNFLANEGGDFPDNVERWKVIKDFNDAFLTANRFPQIKLCVVASPELSSPVLPKLAVIFQPRFEFGPNPMVPDDTAPGDVASYISNTLSPLINLTVNVVWEGPGLPAASKDVFSLDNDDKAMSRIAVGGGQGADAPSVTLGKGSVGFALQRLALGRAPATSSRMFGSSMNHALVTADLEWLALALSNLLDGKTSSRVIQPAFP